MLFIYDSSNRGLRIHSWEVWNTNERRKQCCFVAIHACLVKKERSTTSPETQVLHSVWKFQKKSHLNFLFQILWFLWQKWFIEKVWIWDFLSDFLTLWWSTLHKILFSISTLQCILSVQATFVVVHPLSPSLSILLLTLGAKCRSE